MIKSKVVDGVHRANEANKYTPEELMLMKTQDIGYISQKLQSERKKIEKLAATLYFVESQQRNKHIYYAEDRDEERDIRARHSENRMVTASLDVPDDIKRKTSNSYKELEAQKARADQLEKLYMDMT